MSGQNLLPTPADLTVVRQRHAPAVRATPGTSKLFDSEAAFNEEVVDMAEE